MSIATNNHKTWVEVSKKALQNNTQIVRGLLKSDTKLMAVVKSNAYGHGLVETAKLMAGFRGPTSKGSRGRTSEEISNVWKSNFQTWFGMDNIDEAILLRESGINAPILVLGYTPAARLADAVEYGVKLTCYDRELLEAVLKIQNSKSEIRKNSKILNPKFNIRHSIFDIHLKIDTGMSRQGVLVSDLPKFIKSIPRGLPIEGVYTHFANADNLKDRRYPNLQLANFQKALEILKQHKIESPIVHASATTGLLTMPEAHHDMVRVGIALYGLWPSVEFKNKFKNLKIEPALSWKTRIVQIKRIKRGTPVGYGITERVKKDTQIAVLPVGYYDGYMRALSDKSHVLLGGRRCKILGRISMNLSVVDVSECPKAKISGETVLIGAQGRERITAEELAEKAGTISYEIVSRINPLLPRIYT